MILIPKKDFAKQCDLTVSNLGNYVKRKQVILSGDYVDVSIETNKIFLTKRSVSKAKVKDAPEKILVVGEPEYPKKELPPVALPISDFSDLDLTLLTKEKLHLENQKREREISILEVRKQKLHGIVIPTEHVKVIFAQHFRAVTAEFQNAADDLLVKISKRYGFNANELAELRGELTEIINVAINKSVDASKKNIDNIVNAFSDKKEVGEHQ